MNSDVLFRSIVGYSLAVSLALLIIVFVGCLAYSFLQNVVYLLLILIRAVKKIPSFLNYTWMKLKDAIITGCCTCGVIAFIVFMLYDCFGGHPQKYHNQEEIESIMEDPQWNVPGRYRE